MAEAAYENEGTSGDVPSALKDIIQTYGRLVLQEPQRIEGLVRQACGPHVRERNLLLLALKENVPEELIAPQTDGQPRDAVLNRLKARLQSDHSITSDGAGWVIDTWDFALGFRAQAVSFEASRAKSTASVRVDGVGSAFTLQEKAAASVALIALWTDSKGYYDAAKAQAVTAAQVQQLLDRGADVNAKDMRDWTNLIMAAASGHSDCMQVLIDHGADVNAKAEGGLTALNRATCCGQADCVRALLAHGADVNATDQDGYTALMVAAVLGHFDCMTDLLAHGADVRHVNNDGFTALSRAKKSNSVSCVIALKAAGAIY